MLGETDTIPRSVESFKAVELIWGRLENVPGGRPSSQEVGGIAVLFGLWPTESRGQRGQVERVRAPE